MTDDDYLICPNHGEAQVRLVEMEDDDTLVECLRCEFVCQNFIKDPIAMVYNHTTGEKYLKNVWTGEKA